MYDRGTGNGIVSLRINKKKTSLRPTKVPLNSDRHTNNAKCILIDSYLEIRMSIKKARLLVYAIRFVIRYT